VAEVLRRAQPQAFTERTPMTISGLRERIAQAREHGWSATDEELALGVRAVAVPVTDADGQVRAAITVSALAARVSMDQMRDEFVPEMRAEADKLGRML